MDLRVINFPDKKFKEYLVSNFDKDGDAEISLNEALTIKSVDCKNRGLVSLAGIEFFENLTHIDCSYNDIKEINLNQNTNLTYVNCVQNIHLTNLIINNCPLLKTIYCGNTRLSKLDVSNNNLLEILSCRFTPLDELNIINNPKLIRLNVRSCELYDIDLSCNEFLEFIDCRENNLSVLNLIWNKKLSYLDCWSNKYLGKVIIDEGYTIERVISSITPLTSREIKDENYREYCDEKENDTYNEYNGTYAQDVMGFSDQTISDAFEGDPDACWNVD